MTFLNTISTTRFFLIGISLLTISCSERTFTYSKWDTNGNNKIESYEFTRGYYDAKCFRKWSHGKYSIPVRMLTQSIYVTTDTNRDGLIDPQEFQTTSDYFHFGFSHPSFVTWDRDSNYYLSKKEFTQNAEKAILKMWDTSADKRISQHEMADGIFLSHDKNNNGTIDFPEFSYWVQNRFLPNNPTGF